MRFHDLVFDPNWLAAHGDDGSVIRFSRKERALLEQLIGQAPRLLSRAALADALASDGNESADRNVDFVVNRLRTKLRDSARTPRFIATQYGEGYYWIARPALPAQAAAARPPFLVVGPNHGGNAELAAQLARALQRASHADTQVHCAHPDLPGPAQEALLETARYTLETSVHTAFDQPQAHLALVLRHVATRQIVRTFRATLSASDTRDALAALAQQVLHALWQHGALNATQATPTDRPLDLLLHESALMLTDSPQTWSANEARIARERAEHPDDPRLAVMQALALLSRMVLGGGADAPGDASWEAMEAEIEALVLGALPRVQDDPLLVLSVARALYFVNRGHDALAERLARQTFERSTAFAAAFATLAPMHMHAGRIDEAESLFDQGIALSEPGSEFRVSLMVQKCIALLACDARDRLDSACATLYQVKPLTRMQLGLFVAPAAPAVLAPDLQGVMATFDTAGAARLLQYAYTVHARHFRDPAHRRNVLYGANSHFERHFGKAVASADVIAALGR
ncbi:hypothetical protein CEK29_13400 [Bordetella genomosp. 5]|uniref:winged helix-turn-helix domain-containing protein n=1 Tax=Bordetella genomosp. 5 TaxID=1395608 RepID=UPI000B9E68AF|nr:helix-turn-helix domain-containing protein [Bordetella genomosp. 5]OZI42079.1 hypothetical protein CEK29_13400 [Bordetella genomosp. 5]